MCTASTRRLAACCGSLWRCIPLRDYLICQEGMGSDDHSSAPNGDHFTKTWYGLFFDLLFVALTVQLSHSIKHGVEHAVVMNEIHHLLGHMLVQACIFFTFFCIWITNQEVLHSRIHLDSYFGLLFLLGFLGTFATLLSINTSAVEYSAFGVSWSLALDGLLLSRLMDLAIWWCLWNDGKKSSDDVGYTTRCWCTMRIKAISNIGLLCLWGGIHVRNLLTYGNPQLSKGVELGLAVGILCTQLVDVLGRAALTLSTGCSRGTDGMKITDMHKIEKSTKREIVKRCGECEKIRLSWSHPIPTVPICTPVGRPLPYCLSDHPSHHTGALAIVSSAHDDPVCCSVTMLLFGEPILQIGITTSTSQCQMLGTLQLPLPWTSCRVCHHLFCEWASMMLPLPRGVPYMHTQRRTLRAHTPCSWKRVALDKPCRVPFTIVLRFVDQMLGQRRSSPCPSSSRSRFYTLRVRRSSRRSTARYSGGRGVEFPCGLQCMQYLALPSWCFPRLSRWAYRSAVCKRMHLRTCGPHTRTCSRPCRNHKETATHMRTHMDHLAVAAL